MSAWAPHSWEFYVSLKIEKIFGMISLATLGFLAISCVPNVKDTPVARHAEAIEASTQELPIDLEVDAVRQVELMNAQARPTFHTGESSIQN